MYHGPDGQAASPKALDDGTSDSADTACDAHGQNATGVIHPMTRGHPVNLLGYERFAPRNQASPGLGTTEQRLAKARMSRVAGVVAAATDRST
jgi:hypothetical protein